MENNSAFYKKIFERSPVGMIIYDSSGQCIHCNSAICEIIHGTKEQVLSQNFYHIESWKKSGLFKNAIEALTTNKSTQKEVTVTSTFNKKFTANATFSPLSLEGETFLLCTFDDLSAYAKLENAFRQTAYDLNERVKDLNCFYGISKLVEAEDTIEEILKGTVNLLPLSWQHPEITCAQIKLKGRSYKSRNFTETEWLQSQEIVISGEQVGTVEVYLHEEKPEINERPFLKEERYLINAIAERLGHIVERKQAEKDLKKSNKKLKESEVRFRMLYESAPLPYQSLDYNGHFLEVNQAWLNAMGGYNKDEVIGRSFGDLLLPDWKEHFKHNFPRFKDKGEILGVEFEMIKKDGSFILVHFNGKIGYDDHGNFLQTHCIFQDITQRRKDEEALRQSKEEWEKTFNSIPDIITLQDKKQRIIKANKAAYDFLGTNGGDLVGKYCYEAFRGITDPCCECPNLETIKDIENYSETVQYENLGKTFLVSSSPILDQNNEAQYFVHVARDISEQKKIEEELKASERRFKALHNASFGGIAIHDKGIILECNLGLANVTGYDESELIGMDGLLLIAKKSRNIVREKILANDESPYEAVGVRKNGSEYQLRLEARMIPYRDKNIRVVEFRDITVQKQMEREQKQLQTQLTQAQKMEAIGTLAGGIAHDFNNMLSAMLGYSELAREQLPQNDTIREDLDQVIKAGYRAADLVKQILTFSRQGAKATQPLKVQLIIKEVLKLLRASLPTTIQIQENIDGDCTTILADPTQIHQVIMNLCTNAKHAIGNECGILSVSLSEKEVSSTATIEPKHD